MTETIDPDTERLTVVTVSQLVQLQAAHDTLEQKLRTARHHEDALSCQLRHTRDFCAEQTELVAKLSRQVGRLTCKLQHAEAVLHMERESRGTGDSLPHKQGTRQG